MKDKRKRKGIDELRPEYDFDYSKAVRGMYYRRLLEEGSNVVILDPDIAKAFQVKPPHPSPLPRKRGRGRGEGE